MPATALPLYLGCAVLKPASCSTPVQTTVERVFAFLLRKKVPRQTEGEATHPAMPAVPAARGAGDGMVGWAGGAAEFAAPDKRVMLVHHFTEHHRPQH